MKPLQQKPAWQDRDPGQKFSIIMFGICTLLFAALGVYASFDGLRSGDTTEITSGTVILLCCVTVVLSWKKRNAR